MNRLCSGAVKIVLMTFIFCGSVYAQEPASPRLIFTFKTVNVPNAVGTFINDINNHGVMCGSYLDSNRVQHGFVLANGKVKTLDHPDALSTVALALNLNAVVVGNYINQGGVLVGFVYKNTTFTDIPGPAGATSSSAAGINDRGDIVGDYVDTNNVDHGFLLRGKEYLTLDVPGSSTTVGAGINNHRHITLVWFAGSQGHAQSSLTKDLGKTYTKINVPGATDTYVGPINNLDDIVFTWFDAGQRRHGALRMNGKYYKFDDPSGTQTGLGGLNDRRLIVGSFRNRRGSINGFKASY